MKKQLIAALVVIFGAGMASAQAHKPRVREVNHRLQNQHNRVEQGEKNGTLTQKQANHIEREKRRMMAQDGGHLTKQDQRRLNRQENRVSNEINRDEAGNKAAGGAPAAAPAPA